MGWDAFAVPFNPRFDLSGELRSDDLNNEEFGDPEFLDVCKDLAARGITLDGLLRQGGLDVSTCGQMLQQATGISMYSDPLSPQMVQHIAAMADWSFRVSPDKEWAKESAKAFLNRCAQLGRGIKFSY